MAEYPNLAALRSGLTTDDADDRGRAYGAVLNAGDDIQPSDVLGTDPDEETVDALEEAGVIPPGGGGGGRDRKPVGAVREEQLDILRQILDELRDDGAVVQDVQEDDAA